MTEPTDKQINDAIAELCGYKFMPSFGYFLDHKSKWPNSPLVTNDDGAVPRCPHRMFLPCTNRNLLPEVMFVVGMRGMSYELLRLIIPRNQDEQGEWRLYPDTLLGFLCTDPREVCIAALKACGKWEALEKEVKDG